MPDREQTADSPEPEFLPRITPADCIITSRLPTNILIHDAEEALQATDDLILALSRLGVFLMLPYAVALQDALRVAHAALLARTPDAGTSHVHIEKEPLP